MWRTAIGYILLLIVILIMFLVAAIFQTSMAEPMGAKNPTEMTNVSSARIGKPISKTSSGPSKKKAASSSSTSKSKPSKRTSSKEDAGNSREGSDGNSPSKESSTDPMDMYSAGYFMQMGEIYEGGWRYTWYSEAVLPGGGLDIPGRHVDDEGYVVDYEGRLVAASEDIPYGTEISVPFGSGTAVVRDCGCPSGTIDIYVSW